jgi:hypothetical protein
LQAGTVHYTSALAEMMKPMQLIRMFVFNVEQREYIAREKMLKP